MLVFWDLDAGCTVLSERIWSFVLYSLSLQRYTLPYVPRLFALHSYLYYGLIQHKRFTQLTNFQYRQDWSIPALFCLNIQVFCALYTGFSISLISSTALFNDCQHFSKLWGSNSDGRVIKLFVLFCPVEVFGCGNSYTSAGLDNVEMLDLCH